jgi:hypothetical protein|nr:MAG TPA: hypothetical protein [Caudoviricetes sp.]
MNIWLAALYSLGILGASMIFFAFCSRFIEWAVDNDHMEVFWLATFIVCLIVLTIYIYIEGGTV